MKSNPLSLHHLIELPQGAAPPPRKGYPLILALHGRGSSEQDLIGLAPYLPKQFMWISPRGPFELGPGTYEWFQITQIGKPEPTRLANALNTLDQFINEILENYPVDHGKIYLLGFSQGSILSMSYTLTKPTRIAGVIAQSGYIPHESELIIDEVGIKDKPFIITHGIQDPMLPVEWARRSRDILAGLGANLEYHEFNMAHNVTAESLEAINGWLIKQNPKP